MDPLLPVAPTLTPDEFVRKWRDMALKERSASQSHFNDLCHMLGWPTPTDADKEGAFYAFERGAEKQGAGGGWADVWLHGHEPADDPRVIAIAEAARELVEKRDRWLNPEGATEVELKKRTLTNLYNARPTWLDLAHKKLDAAVFAAYG